MNTGMEQCGVRLSARPLKYNSNLCSCLSQRQDLIHPRLVLNLPAAEDVLELPVFLRPPPEDWDYILYVIYILYPICLCQVPVEPLSERIEENIFKWLS